jgi:hypothetical protein
MKVQPGHLSESSIDDQEVQDFLNVELPRVNKANVSSTSNQSSIIKQPNKSSLLKETHANYE